MAVVVPFIMAASGASAAIGAAVGISATMVSTIASVAFQVTGINDKINKAASKVFGEDLVKFANIAGAGYAMFNGGFDIGGGATDASSLWDVNGMDAASDAFSAAGGTVSDGLTAMTPATEMTGLAGGELSKSALDGTNAFGGSSSPGAFNLAEQAGAVAPTADAGTNLITPNQPLGVDAKVTATAPSATEGLQQAAAPQPGAAGVDAAGNKYSLVSQGNASAPVSSSGLGVRPPASLQPPAPAGFGAKAGSFFDRLLNNEKAMGMAIQGLGQGLTSAQAGKAQQEALDWQKKRYTATGNFRVVQ